ncbi:hypothetical protein HDV00_001964 [Rhizophlyctis rosea]|nr:hypothetical protein HDV00_001964 [Rhizophlyctis rosea]
MDRTALPNSTFAATSLAAGNAMMKNVAAASAAVRDSQNSILPLAQQMLPKLNLPDMRLKRHSALADFVFGSAAGFTSKLVEHPFDTIKVRLQTQPVAAPGVPPLFAGPIDCLRKTVQSDGARALYRGVAPPVIGSMAEHAVLFSAYIGFKPCVHSLAGRTDADEYTISELAACGALAGAFASLVLTPVELIKCKQQVQAEATGSVAVLLATLRKDGLQGMFRGHAGTFLRETAGGAAWFGLYELACNGFVARSNGTRTRADLTATELMAAGSLAGIGYNTSLFPADTIKSIQQTEEEIRARAGVVGSRGKVGFWEVGRNLYHGEGIRGFYRGLGVTLCRSVPGSALIVATFELLTRYCSVDDEHR